VWSNECKRERVREEEGYTGCNTQDKIDRIKDRQRKRMKRPGKYWKKQTGWGTDEYKSEIDEQNDRKRSIRRTVFFMYFIGVY
jgi:hypothetical protein